MKCPLCHLSLARDGLYGAAARKAEKYRCSQCSYTSIYENNSLKNESFILNDLVEGKWINCHVLHSLNKIRLELPNGHDLLVINKIIKPDYPDLTAFQDKIKKYLTFL